MICAPVASASWPTSSPPTTSDSLLASARSIPSPSVATVASRPAEPTIALSTMSQPDSVTSATRPSGPDRTSPPVHASAAWAAASGSASAIRPTPCACAWAITARQSVPALSATGSSAPPLRAMTSSAWIPIDPVDPRMTRRRGTALILGRGYGCAAGSATQM